MRLVYLTANAAHVFTFGDQIIDLDGQRFFTTRANAVDAAAVRGLTVFSSGEVHATDPQCAICGETVYQNVIGGVRTAWAHHVERGGHLASR
jgi:hypothetical protein